MSTGAIPSMPATMHHKTTNKRGVAGGAAAGAVARGVLARKSVTNIAMNALIQGAMAKWETDYMQQHKSKLTYKASENNSIGGYLMLWQDRDANAFRYFNCACCNPKYDAVAVPVRNHSPFTYEELKAHARRQIDENICHYYWRLLISVIVLFVVFSFAFGYTMKTLNVVVGGQQTNYSSRGLPAAPGSKPTKLGESSSIEALLEDDQQPIGALDSHDQRFYILWGMLLASVIILFRVLFCSQNCLFYRQLRGIVSNLNKKTFWKERGVTISLTRPGRVFCFFQSTMMHCVVFQYGLNGKPMV